MSDVHELESPLMGTFYRSSAPGEPPLTEAGKSVKTGDVVCVIESMKIFTELRCDHDGTVKEILAENEEMVMKGQVLMRIEKS